jgi:hypothetical protein
VGSRRRGEPTRIDGPIGFEECSAGDPVAEFVVEPGWYRVRSFHGGFDSIDETGLEGQDYYLAVL